MTTAYPSALDSFTNPSATDRTAQGSAPTSHAAQHANANDAIEAIEAELGLLPKGSHATVKARLAQFELGTIPRLSSLLLAGHSYIDSRGIGNSTGKRGVAARIAAQLGVEPHRVTNLAISGAAMRAAETNGAARYLQAFNPGELGTRPLVAHIGGALGMFGTNDNVLGYSAGILAAFEGGYEAWVARMACAAVYDYNSTSLAYGGTWSTTLFSSVDPPYGSGDGMKTSSTVNSTVVHTLESGWDTNVAGMYVDLTFVTAYGDSGCTVQIKRDSTVVGTKTMAAAFWPTDHGLDVYRLWVPAGTTTITITVTGATSGAVRFNCASYEATTVPFIGLLEMPLPPNPQWVWAGITQTSVDAYNASHDNIVAFFATGDGHAVTSIVKVGGIDSAIGGEAEYFAGDGLHINDLGALVVSRIVGEKVQAMLHAGTITRDQLGAWWYGELDPLTSFENRVATITGDPQVLVDDFNRDDATTPGGSGWTQRAGGWGILAGQLALYGDRFPYPEFVDDFARSDGSVGNGWTQTAGVWAIESGEAKLSSGATGFLTSPNPLVSGDGWLGYEVAGSLTAQSGVGLFFRRSDSSNYWYAWWNATFGTWVLSKVEAGVASTVLNPIVSGSYAEGNEVAINLSGTTIQFYVNGLLVNSTTSSFNENATGCGLYSSVAGGTYRWDNYKQGTTPQSVSPDTPGYNLITRDLGATTGVIGFTVGQDVANYSGFVFRYLDDDNWLTLYESATYGAWVFQKCIGGTITTVTSPISGAVTAGTRVDVEMLTATTFRFYFDGVECSQGLQTVADAPAGTHAGHRYNFAASSLPVAIFDDFLFGESRADVSEGQWARNLATGKMWGPWEGGVPQGSYAFMPTNTAAAGLDAVIASLSASDADVAAAITAHAGAADPHGDRAYADALATGLDIKASVRCATTANITLSGAQTIDGVSAIAGDRVLVKDQSSGAENGIYVVASGAWARAADANVSSEVTAGMFVFIVEGSTLADQGWVLTTNDPIVLGTTALSFSKFSGTTTASGITFTPTGGISATDVQAAVAEVDSEAAKKASNLSDLASAPTALANLGLADVNTQTGTTYTLVLGDAWGIVEMNNASSMTLTIPPNSSVAFPVGSRLDVIRYGAGSLTFAPGSGVTIRSKSSLLAVGNRYAGVTLYQRATDEWVLIGDLA